ncbi:unnamed protein product [Notodromas monacha]|uniref:Cyclin-dependent kinase 2-associated protein 1 n=1 Tax=Notodromas monacha TaxID=399045 RepID=A0A7R9G8Y1_9CRUS|nr:unnamed protein product [Notodromas monacha]CAG0913745.1 unnamed protein product [Notodromas monacha]
MDSEYSQARYMQQMMLDSDAMANYSMAMLAAQGMSFVPTNIARAGQPPQSKYAQLLQVIEEISKDIRPSYAGSKNAAERLKRGITNARILVRECLIETERSARQ